ncbi:MAG: Gfo/Idh/MocA family oxidoreductase [Nocardioides sp.]
MRFGLVGTGPWARLAHGPGLHEATGVELVGVWGRDSAKAAALAGELGTTAYDGHDGYDAMLADVDAVAFAVPPDVQAPMAVQAARAGRHLLLDKPVALDPGQARELADAASAAGVASVVFFTDRFVPEIRAWLAECRRTSGWLGGWLRWFSALQEPGNVFGDSPWRHERGALWDTGPHAVSMLSAALGRVTQVDAAAGAGDLVTLLLGHESGASSTVTLTQFAPAAVACYEATVWGEAGFSSMPPRPGDDRLPGILATAAEELVAAAAAGTSHELDAAFGADVVEILARAAERAGR